jgi:hypothetical protein
MRSWRDASDGGARRRVLEEDEAEEPFVVVVVVVVAVDATALLAGSKSGVRSISRLGAILKTAQNEWVNGE